LFDQGLPLLFGTGLRWLQNLTSSSKDGGGFAGHAIRERVIGKVFVAQQPRLFPAQA